MKKLILFFVALFVATMSFAQSSLVATRSDGTSVQIYYGSDALQKALDDANNGNVITLSSGQFEGATITKNVILRGMGFRDNKKEGAEHGSTVIRTSLKLKVPETETGKLRIEGLFLKDTLLYYTKISKAVFEKCRFAKVRYYAGAVLDFCTFLHCRVAEHIIISPNSNVTFSNCVVYLPLNAENKNSHCEFNHCYVDFLESHYFTASSGTKYYGADKIQNSVYQNSIVYARYPIPLTCSASYCVGCYVANNSNLFANFSSLGTNTWYTDSAKLFSTHRWGYNKYYSETEQFQLTDDAKAKHIGSDGTEIGIHGGSMPYSEDPVRPRLLKVQTSTRTTSKGILPVRIDAKDSYGN